MVFLFQRHFIVFCLVSFHLDDMPNNDFLLVRFNGNNQCNQKPASVEILAPETLKDNLFSIANVARIHFTFFLLLRNKSGTNIKKYEINSLN